MDLKTLEYMEERAGKARKIVKRIDYLLKQSQNLKLADKVIFTERDRRAYAELEGYELMREIKTYSLEAISQEIARLEKELAEL